MPPSAKLDNNQAIAPRSLLFAVLAALVLAVPAPAAAPDKPLRLAAYYPWFPEGWTHANMNPFTHFRPSLGWYDASDPAVIKEHIAAMRWGRIDAATYSWWGQGSPTDLRLPAYLAVAANHNFRFAIYHELEGYSDPSVELIRSDLEYVNWRATISRAYLRIDGRPVVFVYGDADDGVNCDVVQRWRSANTVNAYIVLRSFKGARACAEQPDAWHPYSANKYEFKLTPDAYSISPGFYFAPSHVPQRRRSIRGWTRSVRAMVRSRARFQYVISFNEWGEGTAVESAEEWASPSGFGAYLDVLHAIPTR